MRRIASVLVLLVAVTTAAAAQKPGAEGGRNARRGFWIGFGLGPGSLGLDCSSCSTSRETGGSGYFRLGGTLSQHFLLGFEINGWAKKVSGTDVTMGAGHFVGYWYPSRTGAFYLKLGLGGLSYIENDGTDEYTATGASAVVGVGYEFRVSRNMSITPFLNSMASGKTDLELNGQALASNADFKINMVQLGLGLTWH